MAATTILIKVTLALLVYYYSIYTYIKLLKSHIVHVIK